MASSFVFSSFSFLVANAAYSFVSNKYKIVLVNEDFISGDNYDVFRSNTSLTMADATLQSCIVQGTNLDPITLTNVSVGTTSPFIVSANDVEWQLVTISGVVGAVVYDFDDHPISYIDFGSSRSAYNGTISVPLSRGFVQIA